MGPLKGVKVVELAGIGPGPMCSMLLSDMGATVIRVDRIEDSGLGIAAGNPKFDILARGRQSIAVDLKKPEGIEVVLKLIEQADALVEGFRPGVMERLGLGPEICLKRNPKLVYGRMTGFGQDGPLAKAAGHDINYIALAGALYPIGHHGGPPVPPLNLVGDFGGGAMFLAFGVVCGVLEARASGQGQVVDAAMVDGAAYLTSPFYGMLASGFWKNERGTNILDTGSHFYNVYETKDGEHVSIGSIEPKFYEELLEKTGLKGQNLPAQRDREQWPAMKEKFAALFKTKTRAEWNTIMEGSDICYAPVLSFPEAMQHPHNLARRAFVEVDGVKQPAPAPRFSRTKEGVQKPPSKRGADTVPALKAWGFSEGQLRELQQAKVIGA
jgi:alpha-methylacyl-CoA racemase